MNDGPEPETCSQRLAGEREPQDAPHATGGRGSPDPRRIGRLASRNPRFFAYRHWLLPLKAVLTAA